MGGTICLPTDVPHKVQTSQVSYGSHGGSGQAVQIAATELVSVGGVAAYHTSVVIGREEYMFDASGIVCLPAFFSHLTCRAKKNGPMDMQVHRIGETKLSGTDLIEVLDPFFQPGSYDVLRKNCNSFTRVAVYYLTRKKIGHRFSRVEKALLSTAPLSTNVLNALLWATSAVFEAREAQDDSDGDDATAATVTSAGAVGTASCSTTLSVTMPTLDPSSMTPKSKEANWQEDFWQRQQNAAGINFFSLPSTTGATAATQKTAPATGPTAAECFQREETLANSWQLPSLPFGYANQESAVAAKSWSRMEPEDGCPGREDFSSGSQKSSLNNNNNSSNSSSNAGNPTLEVPLNDAAAVSWGGFSSKAMAQKTAASVRRPSLGSRHLPSKIPSLEEAFTSASSAGAARLTSSHSTPSLLQLNRRRPSRQLWDYNAAVLGVGNEWARLCVHSGDYETSQQNCLHDLHHRHVGARLETPTGKAAADLLWGASEGPRSTTVPWRKRSSSSTKASRRPSKDYLALPPHEEPHQELKQLQELIQRSHQDLASAVPGQQPPWPRTAWTTANSRSNLEEPVDPAGFVASQAGFVARFRQFRGSSLPVVSEPSLGEAGEDVCCEHAENEDEEEMEELRKQQQQQQRLLLELQLRQEQERRQGSKGSCVTASGSDESDNDQELSAFHDPPWARQQRKPSAGQLFESASKPLPMSASSSLSTASASSSTASAPAAAAAANNNSNSSTISGSRRPAKHSNSFQRQPTHAQRGHHHQHHHGGGGSLPTSSVAKLPLSEIFQSGKLVSSNFGALAVRAGGESAHRDARLARGGGG